MAEGAIDDHPALTTAPVDWRTPAVTTQAFRARRVGRKSRETWDISQEGPRGRKTLVKERTRDYMIASIDKTLLRIEAIAST